MPRVQRPTHVTMLKLHKPLIYLLISHFIAKKSGPKKFVQNHPISTPHTDLQPRYPEFQPYIYQTHSESWFPNPERMTTNANPAHSTKDASGPELCLPAVPPASAQKCYLTRFRLWSWKPGQLKVRWRLLVQVKIQVALAPAPPISVQHRLQHISEQSVFLPLLNKSSK